MIHRLPPLVFLTLLLLLSGCAERDLQPALSLPSLSFDELKQRVSRIRGLSFSHDLSLETRTSDEIEALIKKSLREEPGYESQATVARVYIRLGLLPEETDLAKAVTDLYRLKKSVHYNRGRKTIVLSQSPLEPSLALLRFSGRATQETVRQLLLVHALTRALQEQHFQWEQQIASSNTKDSQLALEALAAGDAVLVGLAHAIGDSKDREKKILDAIQALINSEKTIDKELAYLPELLRRKVSFQYLQGSRFALWAYSLKGSQGINGLFQSPPRSTEQILHPEKYYLKREDPVRIHPWGLIRQLRGQKVLEETLGEFRIQVLLGTTLSKEEAAKAASGWAGDSLLAFQQGEDLILGWVTAWDNREEAREFYRSYRGSLEKRHGISLQPATGAADTLIAQPDNHPPYLLQTRENFVFFLDGVPAPRSVEIAEAVWKELETGTESQEIPFDLVRPGPQTLPAMK